VPWLAVALGDDGRVSVVVRRLDADSRVAEARLVLELSALCSSPGVPGLDRV